MPVTCSNDLKMDYLFLLTVFQLIANLLSYPNNGTLGSQLVHQSFSAHRSRGRNNRPEQRQGQEIQNPNNNPNGLYVCVPIGTCNTNGNTIDVRIVTPNQPTCPSGQVACYNTPSQPLTQCGQRRVGSISAENGFAAYGAFPWQAYIENQSTYTGSGVLLDQYHVLTAAHKVNSNRNTPQNINVYMGVWNAGQRNSAQLRTAANIVIHEQFNPTTLVNDIAIIRLNSPVQFTEVVVPACLPAPFQSFVGQSCTVSGWGQTEFQGINAPTAQQKQVTVRIVAYETCRSSFANPSVLGNNVNMYLDQNGELCAGGESRQDACTQDGGAPLVCLDATGRYQAVGLVIWGIGCGRPGVYGVYVDVAKYIPWINAIISTNAG